MQMDKCNHGAVARLIEAGLVPAERREEALAVVDGYWKDCLLMGWSADDVQDDCPGLTDEQAVKVLKDRAVLASIGSAFSEAVQAVALTAYGDAAFNDEEEDDEGDEEPRAATAITRCPQCGHDLTGPAEWLQG